MVVIEFPLLHGSFPNYYDLLGITIAGSARDIQIAFRKTALREHPDKTIRELFRAQGWTKEWLCRQTIYVQNVGTGGQRN